MKVLSICGGIETGYLALYQLGIPVEEYHTFEISEPAIKVSRYHFPSIVHHGNLIGADFTLFQGFDLVLAGTCCQSLSKVRIENSKVNNGLAGKSGIFYELIRALEVIKPRYFMAENVVPSNPDDLQQMNALLGVEPVLINSSSFSAQDRERLYWTNIPMKRIPPPSSLTLQDIMVEESMIPQKDWYTQPFSLLGMDKRVCAELQVNTFEMNRRVYNPAFKSPTLTCVSGGYHEKKVLDHGKPRKLIPLEYERLQTLPDNYTKVDSITDTQRRTLCGNGWTLEVIKHILSNLLIINQGASL